MTVGELRRLLAEVDNDALEIEIIVQYEDEDGDRTERAHNLATVEKRLDPDAAREYVRVECEDDFE